MNKEEKALAHPVDVATSQETQPLKIFRPFSRLPVELRLIIWSFALPPPRVVELDMCLGSYDWFSPTLNSNGSNGLIRASPESREVFLRHYSPICKQGRRGVWITKYEPPYNEKIPILLWPIERLVADSVCNFDHGFHTSSSTYVNFDKDIIYFLPSSDANLLRLPDGSIQRKRYNRWNNTSVLHYSLCETIYGCLSERLQPSLLSDKPLFHHFSHLKFWAISYTEILSFAQLFAPRYEHDGSRKYTTDHLKSLLPSLKLLIVVVDLELVYDTRVNSVDDRVNRTRGSGAVTLTDDLSDVAKSCRERVMADVDVQNFPLKIEFRAASRTELV